ncbi:flagellar basal-body MS-ring/collar protein FliF [Thorsellia kenyensis]|uniref:Flagellar M-ring protein n=1 Tax=Thorsellia kenyensis TaxID=1549888 RepID=A0ABV6CAL7_9GAMM
MNAPVQGESKFSIKEFFNKIKNSPVLLLAIVASIAIAIVVSLLLWARSPSFDVLFSNIEARDGGTIVQQLEQMNIPYQLADNGATILVPSEKVFDTRLKLAQQGLPQGGTVGFELLDKDTFGISQFAEQVNYQRALEGELARTIQSLNSVVSARVHLAIPKPSLFVREQTNPSASITVKLHNGRVLEETQINAIVYLVSSSVAKLNPDDVTIVDQNGRLLTNRSSSLGLAGNAEQLRIIEENEQRLKRNIENILAPVVGNGNVRAQVTLDMDFAIMEYTQENYGPNQPPNNEPAVRSRQISQNNSADANATAVGVPGALTNQANPVATAPIEPNNPTAPANQPQPPGVTDLTNGDNSSSTVLRKDETINFEVDRTIRHSKEQVGKIQRITVAVVVNYLQDEEGEFVPLTPEQRTEIENLVKQAVGFDEQRPRPDSLTIVNTKFANLDPVETAIPIWQQQRFIDLAITILKYLLVLIVAFILWRKLVKPFIARKTEEQEANKTDASRGDSDDEDENVIINPTSDGSEAIVLQKISGGLTSGPLSSADFNGLTSEDLVRHKRSQQRVTTEVKIQRIRDLADKDPRVVALVVRQWISNNE